MEDRGGGPTPGTCPQGPCAKLWGVSNTSLPRPAVRALRQLLCAPALLFTALSACGGSAPAAPPAWTGEFDSGRAWKLLVEQTELGPRPSGSEAAEANRKLIERELRSAGLEPVREPFSAETPVGPIEFVNVWAEIPATKDAASAPVVILASHYDTKRLPFRFVGANDGASSTAAVLELARVLARREERRVTYRVVFFDGEEAVNKDWRDPDNRYGSRHHARLLKESGALARVRFCVLLDLVGDKDLQLVRDSNSGRELVAAFFKAARREGLGRHVDGMSLPVKDDHQSFLAVGVESVDLIDFSYGPYNEWWHTAEDTVDKCSQESLEVIGRIVLAGLPEVEELALKAR